VKFRPSVTPYPNISSHRDQFDKKHTPSRVYWEIEEVDNGERSHSAERVGFLLFDGITT